jgi:FkbM family methyltransferase
MTEYFDLINKLTTINVETILEIGSRDGNDANKLKTLFNVNDSDVWVVEPNPKQILIIKNNYPNFNIISNAIYTSLGTHNFFQVVGNETEVGTSSLIDRNDDWYKNKTNIIEVQTITGIDLLKEIDKNIDICKIDVEGLTYEVLLSFGKEITKIKSFHLECEHKEIWKNQKLYKDVYNLLINLGYHQIYFTYCSNDVIQSDSIWVHKSFVV